MSMTPAERRKLDLILTGVAGLVFLSLLVYWLLGLMALVFGAPGSWLGDLRGHLISNIGGNIGVPGAALAAFLLVYVFCLRFPPQEGTDSFQVKIFSAEFSGPAGPVGLWVMAFLAFILAIWLFRLSHAS